jgi:hypothetical protein
MSTSSVSRPGVSVRATIHARSSASAIARTVFTSDRTTVLSRTRPLVWENIARQPARLHAPGAPGGAVDKLP